MSWNWQLPNWPHFKSNANRISSLEKKFLLESGSALAYQKIIDEKDYNHFVIEILSSERIESSKIEGEVLDKTLLKSSIKQHFVPLRSKKKREDKESLMAELLCNVYESFDQPLTHEMLWRWHSMLFKESAKITDWGKYRSHREPMQIVSNKHGSSKVYFEAPPSERVTHEMTLFIDWFNKTNGALSVLERASIAHVYFESIHPFEDGNGRIGRALVEKILSKGVGHPVLIAVSKVLEKRKKEYYFALEKCNRTLEVQEWIEFFSQAIVQAHKDALELLYFLIKKAKMLNSLSGQINPRQMKVLLRMFKEGPTGFKGGLSAENYIRITKTTRATATRDLTDLVEKGALMKTGELRHTRYQLNLNEGI